MPEITSINFQDNLSNSIELQKLNNVKTNYNNSKNSEFSKLFKEKIDPNKKIDFNHLNKNEKKLYDTCVEMESLLWKQVLNSMKQTINKYKLVDGGMAENIFTDMLYDQYSMSLSKNSSTGLAKDMYKQMSQYL
jgi:Rod binding domain-containing protein